MHWDTQIYCVELYPTNLSIPGTGAYPMEVRRTIYVVYRTVWAISCRQKRKRTGPANSISISVLIGQLVRAGRQTGGGWCFWVDLYRSSDFILFYRGKNCCWAKIRSLVRLFAEGGMRVGQVCT
jgi:hypothetical protein